MKKRGFIFTLAVVMLMIPLILLAEFYATSSRTKSGDVVGKIRCDELHYLVEDINKDMERAMGIFGRRAAIYSINHVVTEGEPLYGYKFNCTSACGINCSLFNYETNGSEAAIAELTMCGTLMGRNVSYMENHTLSKWMERIRTESDLMHFNVTMEVNNITVVMYDAWSFAIIASTEIKVGDQQDMCFYKGTHEISSITSILGLEDVLYPLNTNAHVIKFIENCSNDRLTYELLAGCSLEWYGNGTATGYVVFYSDIPEGDMEEYCNDHADISSQILVMDTAFGSAPCQHFDQCCLNISCPNHFAGAINYDRNRITPFVEKCDMTIPWVTGTGDIDDKSPQNPGWDGNESCIQTSISNGTCIAIKNVQPCRHDVLAGLTGDDVNTSCYRISNVTSYSCDITHNGPSFFDRLDGRYNLSEFYANQSRDYFNNTMIGIESLVNPYELGLKGVTVKENMTWVDYLYWQNVSGCGVVGACGSGAYNMKMDCAHAHDYNLDTDCITLSECPSEEEISSSSSSSSSTSSSSSSTSNTQETTTLDSSGASSSSSSSSTSSSSSILASTSMESSSIQSSTSSSSSSSSSLNSIGSESSIAISSSSSSTSSSSSSIYTSSSSSSSSSTTSSSSSSKIQSSSSNSASSSSAASSSNSTSSSRSSSSSSSSRITTTTICGFYDDMESGEGGWTSGGTQNEWQHGDPDWGNVHSGSNCWGTDLEKEGWWDDDEYENNANEWLKSESIDLTGTANAKLTFWHKLNTERGWDIAYVEISVNGGVWTQLEAYENDVGGKNSWVKATINLNSYAGNNAEVRFRFNSDNHIDNEGWYIDDVNVSCT